MTPPQPEAPSSEPWLRPCRSDDLDACLDVYYDSSEDLARRHGRAPYPRNPPALRLLFEHLLATGPEWTVVAEAPGEVVGFGIASRREDTWFLGFLFVRPAWQARGVGRAILERCLPPEAERARIGTAAEADQPASTGLYAAFGMAPQLPVYTVSGYLRDGGIRGADSLVPTTFDELAGAEGGHQRLVDEIGHIDRQVVGYERPQDHRYLRRLKRVGLLFSRRGSAGDGFVGYGYAAPSGRLGPVAMLAPADVSGALAHLTRSVQPVGAWLTYLPGSAGDALQAAIDAGLRIDGTPGIYCGSWPGPAWDRYLPLNLALL